MVGTAFILKIYLWALYPTVHQWRTRESVYRFNTRHAGAYRRTGERVLQVDVSCASAATFAHINAHVLTASCVLQSARAHAPICNIFIARNAYPKL